jgi:hypothetical protein
MKNLFVICFVLVAGCCDDGVYTPVDPPDAGQDAPFHSSMIARQYSGRRDPKCS